MKQERTNAEPRRAALLDFQLRQATSVGAIVPAHRLVAASERHFRIKPKGTAKEEYNLCNDQQFRSEPVIAECTGFLVASNLIATAAHCISSTNVCDQVIVFDYEIDETNRDATLAKPRNVYRLDRIVSLRPKGLDLAIVALDRSSDRPPLVVASKRGSVKDSIYTIGHPSGLPKKITDDATIYRVHSSSFESDLDAFRGSSGSPVFSSRHEVIGIYVRGSAVGYDDIGGCWIVWRCASIDVCPPSEAIHADELARALRETAQLAEKASSTASFD